MASCFISTDKILEHWQGHRNLTRRVIEAFPEKELFSFSIGGMRTFGEIASELVGMAAPMAHGLATLEWDQRVDPTPDRESLLRVWDESTETLNRIWPTIPEGRFEETITSFGQYTGPGHWQVLYLIDNEVHHRGQGYVYLRALGVEPPPFWER